MADTRKSTAGKSAFRLTSPDIAAGGRIAEAQVFNGFGCTGGNVSPELRWENPPADTRSFALLVHDPDAPTGSGWWHWLVWNIPATATALPAGAGSTQSGKLPRGAMQGRTDFGSSGYGGPAPPAGSGPHHYYFRLHALSAERLEIAADATAAFVGFNVHGNSIGVAELMGIYSR